MGYLLDSTFVLDGILGHRHKSPTGLESIAKHFSAISIISVAELYEGPHHSTNPEAALTELNRALDAMPVVPITRRTCRIFADLRAALRRAGDLRPDLDLLIASTALEHDLTLITSNLRHFVGIPGLRIVKR
jgi:tRNA(fMet)-specific endonuclease VapC